MLRRLFVCIGLAFSLALPLALPAPAYAVTVNIHVGSSLNNGRRITCSQANEFCATADYVIYFVLTAVAGSSSIEPDVMGSVSK